MPSIKPSNKNHTNHERDSRDDLTRQNTQANAASSSREGIFQYTNIRNIRNAKNRQIADHVQSPQQRAHPVLSESLSRTEGDIVVMGGYRGSVLRDAKPPHRQLWAPVKVGLNLRNVNLEVGLTREEEERAQETIIPSGTLSHIGPIDICRRLLKHLRKCSNTREGKLRVHDYGYDWRLSPELLSQRFIKFLESLECNQSSTSPEKRGAIVIAHSLGGLLTRYAINQRPELFAGVVYAGVPQNCVNILGPLRNGDDVLLSSRVLTAQVNFTFRTSFALLPEDGRCFIHKHTNERYDLDFFDSKVWEEHRLSPCVSSPLPPDLRGQHPCKSIMESFSESVTAALPSMPNVGKRGSWFGGNTREASPAGISSSTKEAARDTAENAASALHLTDSPENTTSPAAGESSLEPSMKKTPQKSGIATAVTISHTAAREYLERTLAEILAFKQALAHNDELQYANKYPPHAFIFGKTVPTVYGARVASREAIKHADAFDDLAFAAGDGVVLASAAQLPEGYKCVKGGRVETDRGHVGLLGDLEGVGKCLGAIIEARKRGIGWGNYEKMKKRL